MITYEHFVHALRPGAAAAPPALRCAPGANAERRFSVYRNNRVASLVAGLADGFPVTCQLVGEAFFREMARRFIDVHPPRSPVLSEYGDALPDFMRGLDALSGYPYLPDVAQLERMRVLAWHAADASSLSPGDFAACLAEPDMLPGLHVSMHPSFQLLESTWAVHAIWASHQRGAPMAGVSVSTPQTVAVVRPEFDVQIVELDRGTARLFRCLAQGDPLGAAIAAAADADGAFDLGAALNTLIVSRCVIAITPAQEPLS